MNEALFKDNLIVITPPYMRKNIIDKYSLKYNLKIYDYNDLKRNFFEIYKDDILVYIDNKYNYIPQIGKIILSSLYEIDENKEYKNKKLDNLVTIKKDLIANKYIIKNTNIKSFFNNKDILYLNDSSSNYINRVVNLLKENNNVVEDKITVDKKKSLDIYEFNHLEDEVLFVANQISELLKSGVSIDRIKLNIFDNVYNSTIFKIFNYYNIPIQSFENNLYYLDDTKLFLDSISDDMEILSVNELLEDLKLDEKINNKLVSIINKYVNYKYIKEIKNELLDDIKNTTVSFNNYSGEVKIIDYHNYEPSSDDIIFMMNFNQDKIPKIYKDDAYLSDDELTLINSDTSYDKNMCEKNLLSNFINKCKNIYISYMLNSNFNTYEKSNYIDELNEQITITIKKYQYDYRNNKVNQIILSKRLDDFVKYGEYANDLSLLYSNYKNVPYNTYDNNYKKINFDIIKKQIAGKINLSFSNTNTFFRCKFRFLLNDIYKLNENRENTISQNIGILFHNVLYSIYKYDNNNYEEVINNEISKIYSNPNLKEKYYLDKYKKILFKLISILNDNLENSSYKNTYLEEWFEVDKENDLNIKIVGKIDKVMIFKDEVNTYVIVIDYKTGKLHGDFNKVIYGLDMQLLYYLYLIKNSKKINNPIFTGMYLQPIMYDVMNKEDGKTYDDLILDNMRLVGYTTDNINRISLIDKNFTDNSFIKGLRLKQDGSLYSTSKVLSDEEIAKLIDIVSENIDTVIDSIKKVDFEINPKKIDKDIVGCEYCDYKDICYVNVNNYVQLKKHTNLDFLGGDDNDSN